MQLVAYGAQDVYLTGNPQITFFKVVYRRHTNFSMEAIQQTFNGTPAIGNQVTATISRNGDLVHRMYVQTDITSTVGNDGTAPAQSNLTEVPNAGHAILKEVTVEIGGQKIDKHYSRWLEIWNELTLPQGKVTGYNQMINTTLATGDIDGSVPANKKLAAKTVYIPLQFWFCRNPGLALPLIALQYHEVKVNITFENATELGKMAVDTGFTDLNPADPAVASAAELSIANTSLWVDYIYLDTDERRRFAQVSHEYLIEQLQHTGETATGGSNRLNFNHPVKELIWVEKKNAAVDLSAPVGWNACLPSQNAKLLLNGHDRFAEREGSYFSLVQPFQHHTKIPTNTSIHVYSFALKPEDHQPSGTCNMSRIDNAEFRIVSNVLSETIWIYAVNYNVLRIMGGMGGLAYSN